MKISATAFGGAMGRFPGCTGMHYKLDYKEFCGHYGKACRRYPIYKTTWHLGPLLRVDP